MIRSLRWRLLVATATATSLILGLCGVTLDALIRASLLTEFDNSLLSKAGALTTMVVQRGSTISDKDIDLLSEYRVTYHPEYYELRDEAAHVLARSRALGDASLEVSNLKDGEVRALTLPDGRPGRAVVKQFTPRVEPTEREETPAEAKPTLLIAARDTLELSRTLLGLRWVLLIVCGGATIASAALMAWIIRRGLKSTGSLARRIAQISGDRLSDRISVDGAPAELMPVVYRLNDLLQRLQDAFAREKSFSADVAHELRTPLSGLETALEVAASQPRAQKEYEQVVLRCLDVSRRMHSMVDNLLTLARAESKQLVVAQSAVDLAELSREIWSTYESRALTRQVKIDWNAADTCPIRSDRDKLHLVIQNLFDNAVSYVNAGGRIAISIRCDKKAARIEVANTGSQVVREDAQHVFDRFWRGDAARSNSGNHCGLGLTLCKNIVDVLGGRIRAASEGGTFTMTVEVPVGEGKSEGVTR